jgi:PHP family Zn ribbon phosphoesterase
MHRVGKLADREEGFRRAGAPTFQSLIPLQELIAETLQVGPASKKVTGTYRALLEQLGSEFRILMDAPLRDIESAGSPLLREAVARMRAGRVRIAPGYDGEFGTVRIFEEAERTAGKWQMQLL